MTRSAGAVLLAAFRHDPPAWAVADLTRLDVVELADLHGVLPLLAEVAVRQHAIPDIEAAPVLSTRHEALSPTAVLLAAREQNRIRHADLDEIRDLATQELARADVGFRHLKGGALRSAGVWGNFAARPTRDVDILVADALAIPQVESALIARGFERSDEVETSAAWEDDHHDKPLVFAGRSGSLELHAASLVRRHRDRLTLDLPAAPGDEDIVTTLRHIALHSELQDEAMLQFRLPIVALLDIAFAVEAGLVDPEVLINGIDDRVARRAARVHVGLAARLRGTRIPAGRASALRWALSSALFGHPRRAQLMREAVFAPRALSRPTMEAREGRRLSVVALAHARWRFLRARIPRGVRSISQAEIALTATPSPIEGAHHMDETTDATENPTKKPGFEAAWSSSGLVLVNLATDVLHHLNAPAGVVYELIGDRSVQELVDSYAALAEVDAAAVRGVVEAALDSLAEIGAVIGWPSNATR
jgi:hypothetical protein